MECTNTLTTVVGLKDPIEIAINKYDQHPSILTIKEKVPANIHKFSFKETILTEMEKEVKNLNPKKASTYNNIPTKILKSLSDICSPILKDMWNNVSNCNFASKLKLADITATFKGVDATSVKNCRPISVLPVVSKIFERIMQKQIYIFIFRGISISMFMWI